MNCSTVSVDCVEYSQKICSEIRKARKSHKCHECYRVIAPGEKYEHYVGKMDEVFVNNTCEDCLSVRNTFFNDGWEFGGIWEYMTEHVRDCRYEISEDTLSELTPAARAKVCEEIQDGWDDEDDE